MLAAALLAGPLWGQAPEQGPGGDERAPAAVTPTAGEGRTAGTVDPARVAALAASLGDAKWKERESAEAQLKAMPATVLGVLDGHLGATADAEVLARLERVYRRHVPPAEYIGSSQQAGFLGVRMSAVSADEDSRLYPRQFGVKIQEVIAESAAQAAGLQADDLVVTVDGEEFLGDVRTTHFVERIQRVGEGGKVEIGFFRDDELKRVTVTLTAPIGEAVIPNRPMPQPLEPGVEPGAAGPDPRVVDYRWTKYWKARQETARARYGRPKPEAGAAKPAEESKAPEPAPPPADAEPREAR